MGKGGCDSRLIELRQREQVLLCVLIIIGPIIIGVGAFLYFFNNSSSRDSNIQGFNDRITTYEIFSPQFIGTTFHLNGNQLLLDNTPDVIEDAKEQLNPYTTNKFVQSFNSSTFSNNFRIDYSYAEDIGRVPNGTFPFESAPQEIFFTFPPSELPCKGSDCKGNECKLEACETACPAIGATWNEAEQTCSGQRYLTEICFKIRDSNFDWILGNIGGGFGCYFNGKEKPDSIPQFEEWSPLIYGLNPTNTVKIVIRLEEDPYIYTSQVTRGTFNFGDDTRNTRSTLAGVILMISGGAVTVICLIAIPVFLHWKLGRGRAHKSKKPLRNGGLEERSVSMD